MIFRINISSMITRKNHHGKNRQERLRSTWTKAFTTTYLLLVHTISFLTVELPAAVDILESFNRYLFFLNSEN